MTSLYGVMGGILRKRETEGCTNCQEREDEVDEVYKTLKDKHGTKYDIPR